MAEETPSDIGVPHAGPPSPERNAHGQAAMLLVESLLHGLIARSVLSVADAVEIVDAAAEVNEEIETEQGDAPVRLKDSRTVLEQIRASLTIDLPRG